jgi:mRNA interferase RelE/StbE
VVTFERAALRALGKLPRDAQERLSRAALTLEHTPRPVGCRQMVGRPGYWRIRVGDYRMIYTIEDAVLRVLVVEGWGTVARSTGDGPDDHYGMTGYRLRRGWQPARQAQEAWPNPRE